MADHLHFPAPSQSKDAKHVVLLAGDEEYRSEEALPMLAQLLNRQGFECTVLFSVDDEGHVDPNVLTSLSKPEVLDEADAILMSLRFRAWPDDIMQKFENALNRGIPIVALRTSTHAFRFDKNSPWAKYSFNAAETTGWGGGFGREVLGETWVSHHGKHKVQGTRSTLEKENAKHPILNGVGEIFCTSDVYGASPKPPATVLLRGLVTESLSADSKALEGEKNNPAQPIAWVREFTNDKGGENRIFTTTTGAATDLLDPDLRRLVINAIYWGLDLKVPEKVDVSLPGPWHPTFYATGGFKKKQKPKDFLVKSNKSSSLLDLKKGARIAIVGAGLASRMMLFGHFETELYARNTQKDLYIRNFANEGNTPGFRPHAGRKFAYGFPDAPKLVPEVFAEDHVNGYGFYWSSEEWLEQHKIDTIIAFFGYNSSFEGAEGLDRFKKELSAYLKHTKDAVYNGKSTPQIALVSTVAYEKGHADKYVPPFVKNNINFDLYTKAMQEVADAEGVRFINVFSESLKWYEESETPLTIDGVQLNEKGNSKLATFLADSLYGHQEAIRKKVIHAAVKDKNWHWRKDYKIANGIHVYGMRHYPYGPKNYPDELKKTREMTAVRDKAIWTVAKGEVFDVAAADAKTHKLPEVETSYNADNIKLGSATFKSGEQTIEDLEAPPNYKIGLFADEKMFPNLANPVQLSFDNHGRLWVSCMPSYPHHKIGDPRPNDKILIYEDTDSDGVADKEIVFAENLHLPTGFEITHDGVYVAQAGSVIWLKDTDGDSKADVKKTVLSGFDVYDSHHAISAFSADPSGAIYMCEGRFLRSNIETPYGPVRGLSSGFYRYEPEKNYLERAAQVEVPNPWGISFNDWGQSFILQTSGPRLSWLSPYSMKVKYTQTMYMPDLLTSHQVRPTSGLEIVSSRHFPEEVQGDVLINNTIGFLGTKQHKMIRNENGYTSEYRHDLIRSKNGNFRPVDLEFAPDGSLYVVDWSNTLIGHAQHSARDPLRDHAHGRIYRITYPSRPLVKSASVAGAPIEVLLDNLKLPEYRSRYRTRRELRGRDKDEVLNALEVWMNDLDSADPRYEHHLTEALWLTWGLDRISIPLVETLLKVNQPEAVAATIRAIRYNKDKLPKYKTYLREAASNKDFVARAELLSNITWLDKEFAQEIMNIISKDKLNQHMKPIVNYAWQSLKGEHPVADLRPNPNKIRKKPLMKGSLKGNDLAVYSFGEELYNRDGHCATCHLDDGKGMPAAYFPPLAQSEWVTGDVVRLIKLVLKGVHGEIMVKGDKYNSAMHGFEGMLNDREIASVLTYIRNDFGNEASAITSSQVKEIRAKIKDKVGSYTAEELLEEHPMSEE